MYILSLGKTMADVPDLAGAAHHVARPPEPLLRGHALVGLAVDGGCARGVAPATPPMLHVWLVPHPCGPFAGIEGHGGAGCHGTDHRAAVAYGSSRGPVAQLVRAGDS